MKILAVFVVLAVASVAGDAQQRQQRPTSYPSIRIYHPEYKIPIARPYSTIKRESPASPPVVITPSTVLGSSSRQFTEVKEQVKEEVKPAEIKRRAPRPSVVKVEEKEEVRKVEIKREESKKSSTPVTRSIAEQKNARSYSYGYVIKDQDTFNDFEQQEKRDGDIVTGSYRVSLPDGRIQLVSYRSSPETGNIMKVSYEGEARFPDFVPVTKEKRTPISTLNQALKTSSQGVKVNRQVSKSVEPKETLKITKPSAEVTKTNSKTKEEIIKVNQEIKAVYTRPVPTPPPAKTVTLPVKYSAQYKTGPPAPSKARSVEPFLPSETIPTPERLVATTESPAAPSESLLSLISESLPNPEKFNAPTRARIVEFPNQSGAAAEIKPVEPEQFAPSEFDFNDVFEFDGPLPVPAAFRNRRRVANPRIVRPRIVNPRRRQVERWW